MPEEIKQTPPEQVKQELNKPEVPEVIATRKDAVQGPSIFKRLTHLVQILRKQGLRLTLIEAYEQLNKIFTGAPSEHFSRFLPDVFVGGQFTRAGWPILQKRGVTAVVSMRGEFDDREAGIAPERYLYLPTVDNHAPTLEQLQQGVDFIREELARGGKVYIHCWEGVGRAVTMAAAYLVSTGMTPEDAWLHLRATRPFIRPVDAQIQQVALFALPPEQRTSAKIPDNAVSAESPPDS